MMFVYYVAVVVHVGNSTASMIIYYIIFRTINFPCFFLYFLPVVHVIEGHAVAWLRHYATSRKVAGLIPGEVIEFFN
jgi:hypothetical protein